MFAMRLSRIVALLVTVGLLGLPTLVLGAAPASAVPPYATKLLVDSAPSPQLYRATIQVAGLLSADWNDAPPDPGPGEYAVAGETVYLQRLLAGSSTWATIASAVSDAFGAVRFETSAVSNARYRLVYLGGTWADVSESQLSPVTSALRVHKVARDLNAKARELRRGFRYFGKVAPKYKRKIVILQRNTGNGWRRYDKVRTSRKSRWSFTVPGKPTKGKWRYRAFVKADRRFTKSYARGLVVCTSLSTSQCK